MRVRNFSRLSLPLGASRKFALSCGRALCHVPSGQVDLNNVTNGVVAETGWLTVVPAGFRPLLNWVSHRYGSPIIMVTENGMDR